LYVQAKTFEEMRPGQELPDDSYRNDGTLYVRACSITYDEFVDYVHTEEADDSINMGRWGTDLGSILGYVRIATPLVLLWLYGMAYGHGLTARIMKTFILQRLAHLAYPLYLLHVPIGRYYWYITRGPEAEHWWLDAAGFPIPLDWYEVILVILIGLVLGHFLDRYLVPYLSKYTVSFGVTTCQFIARRFIGCLRRNCCCCTPPPTDIGAMDEQPIRTNLDKVQKLVEDLTGSGKINRATHLKDLGLDSLGATALLGIIKASIPTAQSLTTAKLIAMTTVGELVEFLDAQEEGSLDAANARDEEENVV
jgi:acyl carrier protein